MHPGPLKLMETPLTERNSPGLNQRDKRGVWQRFLHSGLAPLLTHGSLLILTLALLLLLVFVPVWIAFVPGVLLVHRIGVLLHEYLHGIPFRNYRDNLAVYGFFDGALLMFGMMELFRGTHLAHHRWLNAEGDNAVRSVQTPQPRNRLLSWITATEAVQHFIFLWDALHGRQPYVRLSRLVFGAALSTLCVALWCQLGRGDIVLTLMAMNAFTALIPASLRGAIEHHGPPGSSGFANEYRVSIPLFNLNRHVHHHEDMRCPWYLLTFRTLHPLDRRHYFTHWYRVYVKHDYVLMRQMSASDRRR
jgi:fatty acid desaturase